MLEQEEFDEAVSECWVVFDLSAERSCKPTCQLAEGGFPLVSQSLSVEISSEKESLSFVQITRGKLEGES